MTNKTRLSRLAELYYMLKNHDKIFAPQQITFDLNDWAVKKTVRHGGRPHCSTAACALGSAGFYQPFMKKGLKTIACENSFGDNVYRVYAKTQDYCYLGFSAGSIFFKISEDESEFLFDPACYTYKPKAINVALRVRDLYKHYLKNNEPFLKCTFSTEGYVRWANWINKDKGRVPKRLPAKLTPTGRN